MKEESSRFPNLYDRVSLKRKVSGVWEYDGLFYFIKL